MTTLDSMMRLIREDAMCRMSVYGLFCVMGLVWAPPAASAQPTGDELAAMQRKRAVAEEQARQEIESLFTRLCPGRCELIDVKAIVAEPNVVGEVTPGFDGEGATGSFDVELERLDVQYMVDSNLPKAFLNNMPRMLTFRLSRITPNVDVQPVVLEFPRPQAPPMPEVNEAPDMGTPEPATQPDMAPPEPDMGPPVEEEAEPREPKSWLRELWETMLPYLPYIVLALVAFGVLAYLLNWWRELQRLKMQYGAPAGEGGGDEGVPDLDELRRELKQSRAVQNEVLRTWIAQEPESVAVLVRLIGADILADLKKDATMKEPIREVSAEAARQSEPVSPERVREIAQQTRARITAARVERAGDDLQGDWEFVEGLSLPVLQRIMRELSPREKSYAMAKLPAGLRASYMEQMPAAERRDLFVRAGSEQSLSRDEAIALAARLRDAAAEVAHLGSEASGQADIIIDMLGAVSLGEQEQTLRELQRRRPEVAQAVMERFCLETVAIHAPVDVLADAMLGMPVETLTDFLRGTRDEVRQRMVEHAPSTIRGALIQELELDIPVSRSQYIEARRAVTERMASLLQREGMDVASLNAQALRGASGEA